MPQPRSDSGAGRTSAGTVRQDSLPFSGPPTALLEDDDPALNYDGSAPDNDVDPGLKSVAAWLLSNPLPSVKDDTKTICTQLYVDARTASLVDATNRDGLAQLCAELAEDTSVNRGKSDGAKFGLGDGEVFVVARIGDRRGDRVPVSRQIVPLALLRVAHLQLYPIAVEAPVLGRTATVERVEVEAGRPALE